MAAAIRTAWGGRLGLDLLHGPDLDQGSRRMIWNRDELCVEVGLVIVPR